jgi:hypothetical protein
MWKGKNLMENYAQEKEISFRFTVKFGSKFQEEEFRKMLTVMLETLVKHFGSTHKKNKISFIDTTVQGSDD